MKPITLSQDTDRTELFSPKIKNIGILIPHVGFKTRKAVCVQALHTLHPETSRVHLEQTHDNPTNQESCFRIHLGKS